MKAKLTVLICLFFYSFGNAQSNLQLTTTCEDISECLDENCNYSFSTIKIEAVTDCSSSPFLVYTYLVDLHSNGFTDIVGSDNEFVFPIEIGIHKVIFEVSDQCGSVITCESIVELKDCIAPEINCSFQNVNFSFPPGDTLFVLHADDIPFIFASDNCTDLEDLDFSFSATDYEPTIPFSCFDLFQVNGEVDIEVFVSDQSGNQTNCSFSMLLFDFSGNCNLILFDTIPVCASLPNSEPIDEFRINGAMLGDDPNSDCKFFVPQIGFTEITPSRNTNEINGITLLDLILLRKHLLFIQPFDNPYKLFAGDLNNSGGISGFDIVMLSRMILRIDNELPFSWRFVDASLEILLNSPTTDFPMSILVSEIDINEYPLEFIGVKVGDVDCSVDVTEQTDGHLLPPVGAFTFCAADQMLMAGEEVTIPIRAKDFNDVAGFVFTTKFDTTKLKLIDFISEELDVGLGNMNSNNIDIGFVGGMWMDFSFVGVTLQEDEILFSIKFSVLANTLLSEAFVIDSSFVELDAYNVNDERMEVAFGFCNTVPIEAIKNNTPFFLENVPNPFSVATKIYFELEESQEVVLSVFDNSGRKIKSDSQFFQSGKHSFLIEKNDLPSHGLYFFQLKKETEIYNGKFLFLE